MYYARSVIGTSFWDGDRYKQVQLYMMNFRWIYKQYSLLRYAFPRSRWYHTPSACSTICVLFICTGNNRNLTAVSGVDHQNDLTEQQTAVVTLPRAILTIIPEEEAVSIAVAVFNETTLFPVREASINEFSESDTVPTETVVGSQVISTQVARAKDGTSLNAPIQLVLSLNQIENQNGTSVENLVCVFWDFALASKS